MDAVLDKAVAESGGDYQAALADRMPDLVKGAGFAAGGTKPLTDQGEILDRSAALAGAIIKSVKTSHHEPTLVKGMNPVFAKEFGVFGMGMADFSQQAEMTQVVSQMAQQVLGKTITTASPLSTSFVPYDLLAPTKLLYPYYTPMRNKIGRPQGQGAARKLKLVTGVLGSQTPSGSNPFSKIVTSEVTNFSSSTPQAGPTTNLGSQTAVDLSIPYVPMLQTEALSWLAQFEGQGFDDVAALLNLILLQEFTMNEEGQMFYSTGTALTAPLIPVLTVRTAGSNETAITGYNTNSYVAVTAANPYGETVMSPRATVALSAGKVIDVSFATASAATAWTNVYMGQAAGADPGRAAEFQVTRGVGGTRFTIQGAVPTSGNVPPAADSGTATAGGYEGFLSVLSGWANTNSVYPSGFVGGYSNQNIGDVLNQNVVNAALKVLWDGATAGFRADPSECVAEGRDLANLSNDILTNAHSTAYSLRINQDEVNNIRAGGAVSTFVNPLSRSIVNLLVHPSIGQGTAYLMSYTAPHANANIGNLWENVMVQDLMSIKWPVTEMSFRFSIFALGALVAQGPQFSGLLGGLQLSNSTPYS